MRRFISKILEMRANECKARSHTTSDTRQFIKIMNQHNHGSDFAKVEIAGIVNKLKERAKETTEIPSILINFALRGTSESIQAKMPKKDTFRKIIQRGRNFTHEVLPQPETRAAIILPSTYKTFEAEPGRIENFLLWDSGRGDTKIIFIFG